MTNLLTQAIETPDLDAALVPLQEALGIDTGDVAAQAFSEYEDANAAWRSGGFMARRDMLQNWLRVELIWAVPDGEAEKVAATMRAQGYDDISTGGGCEAWCKNVAEGCHVMICDEAQGLGTLTAEPYLVGVYSADNEWENATVQGLDAALAWCAERSASPLRFIAAAKGTEQGA